MRLLAALSIHVAAKDFQSIRRNQAIRICHRLSVSKEIDRPRDIAFSASGDTLTQGNAFRLIDAMALSPSVDLGDGVEGYVIRGRQLSWTDV